MASSEGVPDAVEDNLQVPEALGGGDIAFTEWTGIACETVQVLGLGSSDDFAQQPS